VKIAIVKLSALGDIVHAMVVLQFIKQAMPKSGIDWIVEECFSEVLEYNKDIDNIHVVNLKKVKKNKLKFFEELKSLKTYEQNSYDIVIDMQGLLKSSIVSKILGPNVGFDKNSIREKIASVFYTKSYFVPYEENVITRNLTLTSLALNFEFKNENLEKKKPFLFFIKDDELKTASYFQKDKKNIIYILGSSWESKIYPKEKFVEIINALDGNHLLVWGSESEEGYAKYISKNTAAKVLPKMNFNELKALIAKADLVIGGDSGPTHFAWAMNRASITIFGPTPSSRNILQTPINRKIDCRKKIDALNLNKKDFCIREISPLDIVSLAEGLLK